MKVLIWDGKDDEAVYDASTPELLEAAALSILDTLVSARWIGEPTKPDLDQDEWDLLNMEDSAIDALPKAAQAGVRADQTKLRNRNADYLEDRAEWDHIQSILSGTAKPLCFRRRADFSTDEWEKIVTAAATWHLAEIREDGVYKTPSAWAVLQERDNEGYEYESYRLVSVINALGA